MEFLKDYTLSIMVVSLVAILLENLLPQDNNRKYCNLIIGLFVMLVILQPLTRLPHYDETFSLPHVKIGEEDFSQSVKSPIAQNFEKRLALTICQDLRKVYGQNFECRISCRLNENGQITEIAQVQVAPLSPEVQTYIAEKYGIKEAVITP